MQQFKILPGWDLVSNFSDKLLSLWMQEEKYTFIPVVTDLVALGRDSGIKLVHIGATQIKVDNIANVVDNFGFLKSAIASSDIPEIIKEVEELTKEIEAAKETNINGIVYDYNNHEKMLEELDKFDVNYR